jgi:hypothetical protein
MQLASEIVIGIGALVLGFALVWFGMPTPGGLSDCSLRSACISSPLRAQPGIRAMLDERAGCDPPVGGTFGF